MLRRSILATVAASTCFCGCSLWRQEAPAIPAAAAVVPQASDPKVESNGGEPVSAEPSPERPAPPPSSTTTSDSVLTVQPEKSFVPPTPDSLATLLKIRGLDRAVPRGVYFGVKRPNDEIHKNILAAIDACRRYIAEYVGTEPWCEVKGVLARMELARVPLLVETLQKQGVSKEEAESKYEEHLKDVIKLAEAAAAECPPASRGRGDALHALVYFCERVDDSEKLRDTAALLLKEYPEVEARPYVHLAVGRSYLYTQRYAEAQKYLEEVIAAHSDDPEYVLYNEMLHDALTATGDLASLEDLAELRLAEYPTRIPDLPEDHYLRGQYEQQLCIAPFWRGFVRMARGDNAGAREAFQDHVRQSVLRHEEFASHGHAVKQDLCYITVEHRTKRLLDFLDNYLGKVPRIDLSLGDLWATPRQLTLRESRGKVVALVFRMPGNVRAEKFLQHIDGLAKKHKDDLVAVTLGYRAGKPNSTEDRVLLQKMRDDLKRLQVDMPAGFDPDRQNQSIFVELHAIVGTPSFVLINRKGELAWFLADPRELDRAIATQAIERLLAESKQ